MYLALDRVSGWRYVGVMEPFVCDQGQWRQATPREVKQAPYFEVWLVADAEEWPPTFVSCVFRAETRGRAARVAWACGQAVALVVPRDSSLNNVGRY